MFNSIISGSLTIQSFLLCTAVSLVLGILTAVSFLYKNHYTRSFILTLSILPAIVQMVIMMVNGNIGAGVAVAGTFSLVRFRSEPGTGRQISALFLAVALGIATGMGYVVLAAIFFVIIAAVIFLLTALDFGKEKGQMRDLRISIPESLDYEGVFDDIFDKYTGGAELYEVKSTNMGTLYELRYTISLKDGTVSKRFLDELRTRNGNLTIVCGRCGTNTNL